MIIVYIKAKSLLLVPIMQSGKIDNPFKQKEINNNKEIAQFFLKYRKREMQSNNIPSIKYISLSYYYNAFSDIFFINFAGFPPHISFSGIDFTTTLPAAIIEFDPIVIPFDIIQLVPIKTLSPITMGAVIAFFPSRIGFALQAALVE